MLVAASGGADSTALVHLLQALAAELHVELIGLAHFNHGLRAGESDADEAFCSEMACRLSVAWEVGRGDVASAARQLHTSIEDAGRRLRYEFLERVAGRIGATRVAVGHTRDDQAETVLLNLIRGAGLRGLAAMPARRGPFVRPLLDCTHDDLVAWLHAQGISFREDLSNQDPRFLRNRIRHELMPVVRQLSPSASRALARTAEMAQLDADHLDHLAAGAMAQIVARSGEGGPQDEVVADGLALSSLPLALGLRVARLALQRLAGHRYVGFEQADRLLRLAAEGKVGRMRFPGQEAECSSGRLTLRPVQGRGVIPGAGPGARAEGTSFYAPLSIPGEVVLEDGRTVSSELRSGEPGWATLADWNRKDPTLVVVDGDQFTSLAVRYRRPGDRIALSARTGHKRLQDLFVDRKVPRRERDRTPLVVTSDDRVVWVAGHLISGDFRVVPATRTVVILKLRGEGA